MTLATVAFMYGGAPCRARLDDSGWSIEADASALVALLNRHASPSDFGPADGDPVACAAEVAAGILEGTVNFVRTPDPIPNDAVF
jgi:hypothetical protein